MEQENANSGEFLRTSSSSNRSFNINWKSLLLRKFPIITWLPNYNISKLLHDVLAGFSVGLTEIPQGIAYAGVAGLPLEYGLYSGFMGCFMYVIFGSCKDINMGPTSILALLVQPHVSKLGINMAVLMSFIAGVIIFLCGLLHLGFVVEFFSYPVISGFTSAAALTIASTQIKSLLGITGKSDAFLEAWESVINHIKETRLWDTVLGVVTIIFLVVLKEIRVFGTMKYREDWSRNRNILGNCIFMLSLARNALAVIIGALIAYILDQKGENPFKITGKVSGGLPDFKPPPFSTSANGTDYDFVDMIANYGPSTAFIPLVAILETIAIAKVFSKGRTLDATQELIVLGISNIMGSFVSSMPVTGSFTRTAVNNASGVKTTLGGAVTGIMVLLALRFLTSSFYYIPKATLAAVIICAMFYLFDFKAFPLLWKNKRLDMIPLLVTLLCCIFISLEYGILIGIATNLLFVLYSSARPKFDVEKEKIANYQGDIYVITPRITVQFPAIEYFRELILSYNADNIIIVINGRHIGNIDATVAKGFSILVEEVLLKQQKIYFINFKESIENICTGIDRKMINHFRNDGLEQIIDDRPPIEDANNELYLIS